MDVNVRKVELGDIEKVTKIKIKGWQTAYRGIIDDEFLENINLNQEIEKCNKWYNKISFIVAEKNGEIVGFCRYSNLEDIKEDIDCEIRALYVEPNLKRNGIGKKLFKYAINDLIKNNKKKMILWCLKDNYQSRAFYEKMGGNIYKYKTKSFGEKEYEIISYVYNLEDFNN